MEVYHHRKLLFCDLFSSLDIQWDLILAKDCMVHISSFKSNPKTQYKDQISKISFPEIIANVTSETCTETEAVFRRACVFFCYIY